MKKDTARDRAIPQGYMTVGEVAKKMGVTVRALQYYDRERIFCPSRASEGGRRLYSDEDVVRLNQILALRSLGLPFDKIKEQILALDTPEKVLDALTEQAACIRAQMDVLDQSLQAIAALSAEIRQMQTVDFKKYADIIVNLQMGNQLFGMIKYFGEDLLEHCHNKFDKKSGGDFIGKMNAILARAERYLDLGVAPAGAQGQALAQEFWQLVTEFLDGDMRKLPALIELRGAQADEPQNVRMNDVMERFFAPALETYFTKAGFDPLGENT